MASNLDLFATCLSVAGVPLPGDRVIDGVDLLPTLRGEAPTPHDALYYYKGQRLLGIRQGKWKYLRRHMTDNGGYAGLRQGPFLFNLETDPNESYSLIGSEPEIARRLVQRLDDRDAQMEHNPRGWR
jgi:arylsulfatase A-like enzyme